MKKPQYLQACHRLLHLPLTVETDVHLTSKGFTDSTDKFHPKFLRQWTDFPQIQKRYFDRAYSIFCPPGLPPPKSFTTLSSLEDIGSSYCHVRLSDEIRLRTYINVFMEARVTNIINEIISSNQVTNEFHLGESVAFQSHYNTLGDREEEVRDRQHLYIRQTFFPQSRSYPQSSSTPTTIHADQYCVYKDHNVQRQLMLIVEYKPPHKYSLESLQAGFREMNIKEKVVDRFRIPDKKAYEYFQWRADYISASVAAQTFHYMIENGLEYGYITTGETFVFLRVKSNDPQTLYYHVSVPKIEVNNESQTFELDRTSIGQVVSFILMASQSAPKGQTWRGEAKKQLKRWRVDHASILVQLSESGTEEVQSPEYKGNQPRKNLLVC